MDADDGDWSTMGTIDLFEAAARRLAKQGADPDFVRELSIRTARMSVGQPADAIRMFVDPPSFGPPR